MQNRISHGGPFTASLWTLLLAAALVAVACSWITLTSVPAQAADPNNILLDFSAKWCGPCQQMSPIVSKLERQGFPIRQVDVDQEPGLTKKYKVESIPCFVLIANGREINRISGATDEKQLRRLMMMLPKQNIDDAVAGTSSDKKGAFTGDAVASTKSPNQKKGILSIPPLFSKEKKNPKPQANEEPEVARGKRPSGQPSSNDIASSAMVASTRIRVKDGSHVHYGSGTVIASQPGKSVILTCGHILRKLGKNAVIEVDLFCDGSSNPQTTIAQILETDLEADVGLLAIAPEQQLPVIRLAIGKDLPKVNDRVFSIGCGGGKLPSIEEHTVTAINGFDGPDNLECTGVPLQGRSGGGLFMGTEQVGVCILADANYKRGIYTAMKPVAQLLQKAGLGYLAPSGSSENRASDELRASIEQPTLEDAETDPSKPQLGSPSVHQLAEVMQNSISPNPVSSELTRDYEGAEIVCTIRPRTPGGVTRVVIINQASTRFVNDLLHESGGPVRTEPSATVQNRPVKQLGSDRPLTNSGDPETRVAMQKANAAKGRQNPGDRPIETSFEAEQSNLKRD